MDLTKAITSIISIFTVIIQLISALFGIGGGVPTDPPVTDEPPTSIVTPPVSGNDEGKFVFTSYGWGHGVGMSQDGAIAMANSGKNYQQILLNYYTGTSIKTDSSTPTHIKYGGKSIPIVEYLCRTAKREIGPSAPTEALKAQIVAIYTFAKWYNFDVGSSRHAYDATYNYKNTNLHKACLSVLGMANDSSKPSAKYVDYQGSAAFTSYFDSCAGKTTSAASTWGGDYPYLCGGNPSPEQIEVQTVEYTASQMKSMILAYDKNIVLESNPSQWLKILSHDSAYSSSIGYVANMKIGNKEIKGNAFRSSVTDLEIHSHCFKMEYIPG